MKKLLSLILVSAMCVMMLAGCGKEASNTWKIGGIGPITGAGAAYGNGVMNATQIAVDEINAAGGIKGCQIEFKFEDDELDAEKSVNAYNSLKDWKMQMLVGTVTSGCCVAVGAKTAEDNMFVLTPSASSVDVINGRDNVFQVCFTDPNQGIGSADYIGTHNLAEKVAVIHDSSDVYSTGLYDKFIEQAKQYSFQIVSDTAFTADSKTDFTVQLQQAKDAGATLVFLPFYYQEAALVLTQADSMGYKPLFFGCDGMDGILTVDGFNPAIAEGLVLLTPFAADATDAKTQAFVKEYVSRYGETPNQFAADAYDAVYAIKECLEKSSVTPASSVSEICEALKSAITSISYDGLTGESMTWAATGEVSKAPKAMVIKNGEYALIQ